MNNQVPKKMPVVVVAAAILQREEKILLTRRKLEAHQGGLWEFPGGKREVGESLEQCLRRELKEEIDIEICDIRPFYALHHCYPEKEVELNVFTCSIHQGEPKAIDCIEMAWVHRHELSSYGFPAANQPVVKKILQGFLEKSSST